MRTAQRPATLGALGLSVVAHALACSSEPSASTLIRVESHHEGPHGTALLELEPITGLVVDSVQYLVTRAPAPGAAMIGPQSLEAIVEGVVPTLGDGGNLTVGIELPAGENYTLSLLAEAGLTTRCAGATAPFAIRGRGSTPLQLELMCTDLGFGSAGTGIDVENDGCPEVSISAVTASPASAALGAPIALQAHADDLSGRPLLYAWSVYDPAIATFASVTAAATTLTCLVPKDPLPVLVTIANGDCSKMASLLVKCTP